MVSPKYYAGSQVSDRCPLGYLSYHAQEYSCVLFEFVLFDFLATVMAAPHECVIRSGLP